MTGLDAPITVSAQDHPLRGAPHPFNKLHPLLYLSEFIGTAVLVFVGLSVVIALWGKGAPFADLPLSITQRRLVNGTLFGATGAAIAFSRVGKISGAHINPAVTLAFWVEGKIKWRDAVCYVLAQLAGAAAGASALLVWGAVGASDLYGAAVPEPHIPLVIPLGGEVMCTFLLIALIFAMASNPRTQPYTPLVNPPLFALLVWLESPLSGASANPARSFGPALIARLYTGQWIYFIGPCAGAVLAVLFSRLAFEGRHRPAEARLFHFQHRPHEAVMKLRTSRKAL